MWVPTKSMFKSKLFWLGVAEIANGVADMVQNGQGWPDIMVGVLIIVLRYYTAQPVAVRSGKTVARDHRKPTTKRKAA